jgi:cyanophycin synthetase
MRLDEIATGVLAEQGLTPGSVPAAGRTVLIRRNANLSTGGTAIDVTDEVHPTIAARAIDAARVVGLDIAGIDVVACDLNRPLEEQHGAIVEVNAAPGLRMHLAPSSGEPRPVGEAIVDMLFPDGSDGRIPVIAVTGVNGKTTTTRLIAHLLKGTGRVVGMTCTDGIYIDDRRIDPDDCSGPGSARAVLANPAVEMAVLETARGGILREGLGFDRCDVAVVTNIGDGDHLGLSDIDTLEKLARVKRVIVEAVAPTGVTVLNAADPLVAEMAEHCPGETLFFARDGGHPVVREQRARGGRVAFVRENTIVVARGDQEIPIDALHRVPLTHGGRVGFQVENTLAAVSAAWAVGVPVETIVRRLESFTANLDQVPGRFNVIEVGGATVILDYGHNPSALAAVIEALDHHYPHAHRTAVYSTAGDRRDCDIVRQGELLGAAFDRVLLYEDHYLRGRQEGEIISLLRQGLCGAARASDVAQFRGSLNAVQAALESIGPGRLLLVQADEVDETVAWVRQFLGRLASSSRPEVVPTPALSRVRT